MAKKSQLGQNIYYSAMVGLAGLVYAVFYATRGEIALSLGKDTIFAGYLVAIYAIGAFCGHILWGGLSDRIGKARIVMLAGLLLALGLIMVSISTGQVLTLSGLLLMGCGASAVEIMSSALLTDRNASKASRWINISQVCFCIGAIGAPMLALWFLSVRGRPLRELYLILSILLAGFLLLRRVQGRMQEQREVAARQDQRSMLPFFVLKNMQFTRICGMVFLYCGCESLVITYLKPYFQSEGSSDSVAALAISIFWLAMIMARLLSAALLRNEVASVRLFSWILLSGILCLSLASGRAMNFAGAVLVGFGCGPLWCHLFVLGGREYPEHSGAAFAVMTLFASIANTIFPVVFGSWVNNLRITFVLCAALVAGLLVCLRSYGRCATAVDPS